MMFERVYPADKMVPVGAFAPRYHKGQTPGRFRWPSGKFPGWFACGYPPGERKTIKQRHTRRSRRYRQRWLARVVADVLELETPPS